MTIQSQTRTAGPFVGSGAVVPYPFNFKVFQSTDVLVVRSNPDGSETTLTMAAEYNVTLNTDQETAPGGIVQLVTGLPTGYSVVITSAIPELQKVLLTNQGGFYPKVISDALDYLTILVQQLRGPISRALKFPLSDSGISATLPSAADRANTLLGFDSAGRPVVTVPGSESATGVGLALASYISSNGTYLKNSVEKVVNSIEDLRQVAKTANTRVRTLGYWKPGDRGAGEYYWDPADVSSADNLGTIIVANDGGRWKLVQDGPVSIAQFGARGNDPAIDDTQFIQAAINASYYQEITVPAGEYYCTDLYFGTNSTTTASISPYRFSGVGTGSIIAARPGTSRLFHARNLTGVTIEDICFRGDLNAQNWILDTDWTLSGGPSLNNIWRNIRVNGSGGNGSWTANNNNDCVFQKIVVEGVTNYPTIKILAAGGAVKFDDVTCVNGHIQLSSQNFIVNGGYNFGIQFEGIINSTTLNNVYTYVNGGSGSCFWGGDVSMIINGGLLITDSEVSLASTPGQGSVFDCTFNSDSTAFNVNYAGTRFGLGCRILGPNAKSSLGSAAPIRLTLNGGTGESGTVIDTTDNAQVYVGTANLRNNVGFSTVMFMNQPAPTKKGTAGPVIIPTSTYAQIIPTGAVLGDAQGVYLLHLRIEISSNPLRLMGACLVPILLKTGGTSSPVIMSTDAYIGGGVEIRVRTCVPTDPNLAPGIELSAVTGAIDASIIYWSLTKLTQY